MSTPVSADELSRLLDERGGSLALYASQWTVDAEDCVQEALLELARLPCVPESPVAWLYRVVKHRAMNRARGERRRRIREKTAWQQRLADRPTPTDLGERIDLAEALAGLGDEDRELVLLRVEAGLSFAEIAEVVGSSSSTVHRQYTAALQTLRCRLDDSNSPRPIPEKTEKKDVRSNE